MGLIEQQALKMQNQDIYIRELDLNMISPNEDATFDKTKNASKIVVIGKPGTGKTTLISSILYAKRSILPVGVVVSGTEDSNEYYAGMFPSTFVYSEYESNILDNFRLRQKYAKHELAVPWALCLLDDCTDDTSVLRTKLWESYFKNGRHWNMLFILSLQYCLDVRPSIRINTDGVFILREMNISVRKKIWDNYASIVPFPLFCALMDKLTEDYSALYIHNASTSNDWRDCVFWYKAPLVPKDFKFGCQEYWDYHYARVQDEYRN